MKALDAHETLSKLLDLVMQAKGGRVAMGEEMSELGGSRLAIVGQAYTAHGQAAGTVAVIGPTRMDYPRVMPLVAATANAMSEYIDRSEGGKREPDEQW